MNIKRLTIDEITEFKPSVSRPLEVVCDDGYFTDDFKRITIISTVKVGHVVVVWDAQGELETLHTKCLKHYPSISHLFQQRPPTAKAICADAPSQRVGEVALTYERVQKFAPSYNKPLIVFTKDDNMLKIISPLVKGHASALNSDGNLVLISYCDFNLYHFYPESKEPKFKEVEMYRSVFKGLVRCTSSEDLSATKEEALALKGPSGKAIGYKPVTVYLKV